MLYPFPLEGGGGCTPFPIGNSCGDPPSLGRMVVAIPFALCKVVVAVVLVVVAVVGLSPSR